MRKRRRQISEDEKRKNADFLSYASIAIGLLSCVMCCIQSLGIIFAIISAILGIAAIISGGRKYLAIPGILIALIGFGFSIAATGVIKDFLNEYTSHYKQ